MPFGECNLETAKEIGVMNSKVLIAVSGEGILRRCSLMREVLKAGNSCFFFVCVHNPEFLVAISPLLPCKLGGSLSVYVVDLLTVNVKPS